MRLWLFTVVIVSTGLAAAVCLVLVRPRPSGVSFPATTSRRTTALIAPKSEAAPHREPHDGVSVAIDGGGLMRESAPYIVPDRAPRPVTMILHGLCAEERWMCDWLQHGDLSPQWQICPRAPTPCGNGGAQWTATTAETLDLLARALATTKSRHGARVGEGLVLAGMSQGAYTISHLVHELAMQKEPTLHVRGVVMQGASVQLSAAEAKKLGIRVVLAAGDQDGAAPAMRALANTLKSQGVEARYASFGAVGHFLPVDTATTMSELLEWARGP